MLNGVRYFDQQRELQSIGSVTMVGRPDWNPVRSKRVSLPDLESDEGEERKF